MKSNGVPIIICVGNWWPDRKKHIVLRRSVERMKVHWADISGLYSEGAFVAASERTFVDHCVGIHPGDEGMRGISESIIQILKQAKVFDRARGAD